MLPDITSFLAFGLIVASIGVFLWFQGPRVVAIGARQRLAAGWTLRQIRLMSFASFFVLVSFCFTAPPSASVELLGVMLLIGFGIAYYAHGRSAMWQLFKLTAIAAMPYFLVKLVLALYFPEIG